MVDLILIAFCLAVFYAGFRLGNKYTSLGSMFKDWKAKAKNKLD